MKQLLIPIFFFAHFSAGFSQEIQLTILPEQPTPEDSVYLIITYSFPRANCDYGIVSKRVRQEDRSIYLQPEFCPAYDTDTSCEVTDTTVLPPLLSGAYTIQVVAGMTGQCPVGNAYEFLDSAQFQLSVASVNALPERAMEELNIYPNPTRESLHIALPAPTGYVLQILDIYGQVIRRERIRKAPDYVLDCRGWLPGMYFLALVNSDTRFAATFKFIIN